MNVIDNKIVAAAIFSLLSNGLYFIGLYIIFRRKKVKAEQRMEYYRFIFNYGIIITIFVFGALCCLFQVIDSPSGSEATVSSIVLTLLFAFLIPILQEFIARANNEFLSKDLSNLELSEALKNELNELKHQIELKFNILEKELINLQKESLQHNSENYLTAHIGPLEMKISLKPNEMTRQKQ